MNVRYIRIYTRLFQKLYLCLVTCCTLRWSQFRSCCSALVVYLWNAIIIHGHHLLVMFSPDASNVCAALLDVVGVMSWLIIYAFSGLPQILRNSNLGRALSTYCCRPSRNWYSERFSPSPRRCETWLHAALIYYGRMAASFTPYRREIKTCVGTVLNIEGVCRMNAGARFLTVIFVVLGAPNTLNV